MRMTVNDRRPDWLDAFWCRSLSFQVLSCDYKMTNEAILGSGGSASCDKVPFRLNNTPIWGFIRAAGSLLFCERSNCVPNISKATFVGSRANDFPIWYKMHTDKWQQYKCINNPIVIIIPVTQRSDACVRCLHRWCPWVILSGRPVEYH